MQRASYIEDIRERRQNPPCQDGLPLGPSKDQAAWRAAQRRSEWLTNKPAQPDSRLGKEMRRAVGSKKVRRQRRRPPPIGLGALSTAEMKLVESLARPPSIVFAKKRRSDKLLRRKLKRRKSKA